MLSKSPIRFSRWLPVFGWMLLIFVLSSISSLPGPQIIWWDFVLKKSAHMFVFAVLFLLTQNAFNGDKPANQRRYFGSFIIVLLYAVSDEWHQSFTPGRSPKLYDIGFDMLGAWIAYVALILTRRAKVKTN